MVDVDINIVLCSYMMGIMIVICVHMCMRITCIYGVYSMLAYINNVHKMYMLQVSSRASGGPAEGQGRRVLAAGAGRHAGEPGYVRVYCICMRCILYSLWYNKLLKNVCHIKL